MDVRKKIDHLSMMEPKDWKNDYLKEALKSFLDALKKRLDSPAQEIQNEDYNKGSQFLDHFCCAFIHKEGCDMARIELRIIEYPKYAETPKKKLRGLAILTEATIDDLEFRV
ncbi:hypothetical protein GCK32_022639 [Trichostrongylus colubriformis]|uniref:Uncharacterized protein n=1 Tax=Trichostrongylus colubriformis TaxID=6319 RepID=A0AAN8F031_TRICO